MGYSGEENYSDWRNASQAEAAVGIKKFLGEDMPYNSANQNAQIMNIVSGAMTVIVNSITLLQHLPDLCTEKGNEKLECHEIYNKMLYNDGFPNGEFADFENKVNEIAEKVDAKDHRKNITAAYEKVLETKTVRANRVFVDYMKSQGSTTDLRCWVSKGKAPSFCKDENIRDNRGWGTYMSWGFEMKNSKTFCVPRSGCKTVPWFPSWVPGNRPGQWDTTIRRGAFATSKVNYLKIMSAGVR